MNTLGGSGIKKSSIASNMFWKFAERMGAQVITLIVSIVVARLLLPEEYGLIAMVIVFISIVNIFVSEGIGSESSPNKCVNSSM